MQGQFLAGAVNLEFGWAPFMSDSLPFQGFPVQSTAFVGGFLSKPSHQTVLSSKLWATFVKIVFVLVEAKALKLDFSLVPGATPKKPFSGFIAYNLPSLPGLIQAISSPTVQTL